MDQGKRALVVETLNKLLSSSNGKAKVQHVEQLEELLLRNEPALLDEFLSEMVPLQMDKAVSVRRKLLEFVAAAVRVRPSPAVLSTAAPCVTGLLSDEQAQLAREAAQAAHVLLTRGLSMLAAAPQGDAAAAAAWGLVQGLQRDLSNMAASLCGSHGGSSSRQLAMCLAGIKMAEQAVLHYTAATQASMQLLPVAAALASEVQRLGQLLVQLLDVGTVKQRAGPVVIAAVKGLGCCCMQRQQLLPALLPPLLTLAEQGVFKSPRADEKQSGVAASCGAALQDALVRLYRSSSSSEAAKPWRQKLHAALVALGAEAAAASAQRHLERQAVRAREGHKRKAADQAGRDAKQARPTTPAADSSAGNTPTRTPTPGPGATPSSGGGGGVEMPTDLMALFRPGPGVNMVEALNNAQQVLEVLVQAQQEEAVQAILACVAPEVLAELVTRWMENLPAEQPGVPAGAQQQQQQQPAAVAGGQPGSMQFDAAGLSQFLASQPHPAQPPKQQAATDPRQKRAAAAAAAAAAASAAAAQQPSQPPQQPPPLPVVPAALSGPPLPSPLPTALKPQQVSAMRTAAVQRILRATGNKPIRNFRELLLSRLASRAPASEGLTQLMLTHVLADYHRNRGHVLLVRWLYALAATVATSPSQQQQQEGEGQPQEEQETHTAAGGGDTDMPDAPPAAAAADAAADAAAADEAADDPAAAAAAKVTPSQPAVADASMDDAPDLELARAAAEAAAAVAAAEAAEDRARAARRKIRAAAAAAAAAAGSTAGDGAEVASSPAQQQDGQQQVEQGEQQHQHQHQHQQERPQQEDGNAVGDGKQQQQQPSSSNSSSSRADLSGTPYESVLLSSLQGLRETLPSTDPAIPRLLQDAPVLPLHAVTSFLQDLIAEGSDWAGVGLSAAYGLFESRPAARQALLQLLLDAAVSADSMARERAVGLIVSKLLAWEAHAATVLEFARQHLLQLLQPPAAAEAGQEQQQPDAAAAAAPEQQGMSDAEKEAADKAAKEAAAAAAVEAAAQHSMLYLSLCTVKPELLQLLLETYSKAGPSQRTALSRYAPSLALAIGPTAPELLRLVAQPPDEPSQQLLLTMLTALADAAPPPAALVQACTTPFKATGSVTLLDPVVAALNKGSVTKLLPDLLTQLPDGRLRLLYRRLGLAQHGQDAPLFAPVELLVLLHKVTSEPTMPQSVFKAHTKKVLEAVDRAMRTPEVFPAAVMQTAISRMEAMNPPPRLFMRSVAVMAGGGPGQARVAAPIAKWIISLLERLIQKQIWENKTQWRGFLLCCEKLQEQGSPLVLLQLPENILEQALGGVQPSLWKKLHDVVEAPNCPVVVYKGSRQVVNKFYERFLQKQIDDRQAEIAKAAADKAAAAERAAAAAAAGGSGGAAAAAAGEGQQQPAGWQPQSLGDAAAGSAAGARPKPQAAGSAPPDAAAASGAKQQQQQGSDGSGKQRVDDGAAAAAQPQTAGPTQHQQEGGQGAVVENEPDDEDDFVLDFEDE